MNVTLDLYHEILPKLNDFLYIDKDKKDKKKNNAAEAETY